jgi:hypothetical protein
MAVTQTVRPLDQQFKCSSLHVRLHRRLVDDLQKGLHNHKLVLSFGSTARDEFDGFNPTLEECFEKHSFDHGMLLLKV